jgi:uncharacterized delta-60 repeat protein
MSIPSEVEALESRRLFAAGDIDSRFGISGIVNGSARLALNDLSANFEVTAIAAQADGGIYLAGDDRGSFFVAHLTPDLKLDLKFADSGVLRLFNGNDNCSVASVAVDSSGRLVLAGTITMADAANSTRFVVVRVTPAGALDARFHGGDGMISFGFGEVHANASSLAIAADGRILVAGSADNNDGNGKMAVARLTAGGRLDPQFSADGRQIIDCGTGDDSANAISVLNDGSVVLSGALGAKGKDHNAAVVRLDSAGHLDQSFANKGIAAADFGGDDFATAQLVQSDGRIVIGGTSAGTPDEYGYRATSTAMARLLPNGSLDTSFNGDGRLGPNESFGFVVAPLQIILGKAGVYRVYAPGEEIRITPAGGLDTSFGDSGSKTFAYFDSISTYDANLFGGQVVRSDGSVLTATNAQLDQEFYSAINSLFVTQFNAKDSSITTSHIVFDQGIEDAAVDAAGKLLVASNAEDAFAVYRLNPSGSLDSTFAGDGRTSFASAIHDFTAYGAHLIPLGDQRYLVRADFGADPSDGDAAGLVLARGNADGSGDSKYPNPDPSGSYVFSDETGDGQVELLPHGFVSATYVAFYETTEDQFGFLIDPSGSVQFFSDPNGDESGDVQTFVDRVVPVRGTDHVLLQVHEIATQYDPSTGGDKSTTTYELLKQDSNGLVSSFGNNGQLSGGFDVLDVQSDGRVLYGSNDVRRLSANGANDKTFGTNGVAGTGYSNFAVDEHDRIIAWKIRKDGRIQIARFSQDGKPDKSFSGDGQTIVNLPVNGGENLLVTPNDSLVLTSLHQSGTTVNWSATRILG